MNKRCVLEQCLREGEGAGGREGVFDNLFDIMHFYEIFY